MMQSRTFHHPDLTTLTHPQESASFHETKPTEASSQSNVQVPESFLARRVPELQLYLHPGLDAERAGVEIHADRGVRHVAVDPVREAFQQRRLPHRGVPEQDDSELVLPQSIHGMTRR